MALSDARPLGTVVLAERRPLERVWPWLAPALLTGLVILDVGYSFGEPNHVVYLPWILRRIDPTLLANDWFANTTPAHPNAIEFLVWIQNFIPLPAAMLLFHVLSVFAVLWVTYRLVDHLFGDIKVLLVGIFLVLRWGTVAPGNNTLWGNCIVPHNAAVPLCLLAFYLVLKERPVWAAAALGAATWIHIQLGCLTMLVIGLGLVLRWRHWGVKTIALAALAYFAIMAPTLIAQWRIYMMGPNVFDAKEYLYLHAILRQPHHLIPSSWPGSDWYRFALAVALAAAAGGWMLMPHKQVLAWAAIIVGFAVIVTIFVEVYPVKLAIRLQPYRLWIFVKFFALLYAARFLLRVVEQGNWGQKLSALGVLTIQNFSAVGMCAALIFALRQTRRWMWGVGLFGAGVIGGVALVATTSPGIPMFWHSFAVSPRGMWVAPVTLLLTGLAAWRYVRALPVVLLSLIVVIRAAFGLPYFSYNRAAPDDWTAFCERVKQITPKDAVFITPPYRAGFQLLAERAEVVNFKCTPMYESELAEWKQRLNDLAGAADLKCSGWEHCASALAGGYMKLDENDFVRLARKYSARYVVTVTPEQHLHTPVLLQMYDFKLYQVPD